MERTRSALLTAFRELIQTHSFDGLTVAEIALRAKVSRSTFYQHFSGKTSLLSSSVAVPFDVLSDTVLVVDNTARLVRLLDHFWMNRDLARSIFTGPNRRSTAVVLVMQIEKKLKAAGYARRGVLILPLRLASIQLAETLLGPVIPWLMGESRCRPEVLATALRRTATAMLASLAAGGGVFRGSGGKLGL